MQQVYYDIPETAVEVQTGLWAEARTISLGSMTRVSHRLYSAEGYCFYILANSLDEEGNLLPEEQRTYYTYMNSGYQTIEQVNANVVSVPVEDGYEIVGGGSNHETV